MPKFVFSAAGVFDNIINIQRRRSSSASFVLLPCKIGSSCFPGSARSCREAPGRFSGTVANRGTKRRQTEGENANTQEGFNTTCTRERRHLESERGMCRGLKGEATF
ncbi:hypothetical protein TGRH88_041280 [Toxoplasma gondii]|uniref:Uncharacterized protein n=1 Tax=Toxoplasma gondii TaxID=5811 RepID=A0A7J6JYF5_TOXGO|nr:hypothetical protein TGRH88_041280 [Toxoplasma gondii]